MCACDDSVSRAEKFRRLIDGLKRGALIGCHPRNFCAQNDVFLCVRVGFVLRLTLDKQIGMCPRQEGFPLPRSTNQPSLNWDTDDDTGVDIDRTIVGIKSSASADPNERIATSVPTIVVRQRTSISFEFFYFSLKS